MGEADWWCCSGCQSLNNLSARTCYSCGTKKPRDAARASEMLGYRVVESWDGKVRLEQLTAAEAGLVEEVPAEPTAPPPLREPVRRSIVAIAPRPGGARITYRPEVASVRTSSPGPGLPWAVPGTLPPSVSARRPVAPGGPGMPPPALGPPPWVPVGPGAPPGPAPLAPSWPHWRELLDGPQPDGERIRSTYGAGSEAPEASLARAHAHGGSLSRAIKGALQQRAGPEPEWPAQDRSPDPAIDPWDVGGQASSTRGG